MAHWGPVAPKTNKNYNITNIIVIDCLYLSTVIYASQRYVACKYSYVVTGQ